MSCEGWGEGELRSLVHGVSVAAREGSLLGDLLLHFGVSLLSFLYSFNSLIFFIYYYYY
jgi:hypothetical protein